MKKFFVLFSVIALFLLSCSSGSKSSDQIDDKPDADSSGNIGVDDSNDLENITDSDGSSEIGDDDSTNDSDSTNTTSDDDTTSTNDAGNSMPDNNNSDDSDSAEEISDPCDPNPCDDTKNSTGTCFAVGKHYICECKTNYAWKWNKQKCQKVPSVNLSNICTHQDKCANYTSDTQCPTSPDSDFYGQDPIYAAKGFCLPQHFTIDNSVSEERTVIDSNTGLEWSQKVITSSLFTGLSFSSAINVCGDMSYGGHRDWRLPTPKELLSIVNNGKRPSIDTTYFPNICSDQSCIRLATSENDYYFFPYYGGYKQGFDSAQTVLCVRGTNILDSDYTTQTVGEDIVVRDDASGLMWLKDITKNLTWQEALAHCEKLIYAGYDDWRLPNKNELTSIPFFQNGFFSSTYLDDYSDTYLSVWQTGDFGIIPSTTTQPNSSMGIGTYSSCVRGSFIDIKNEDNQNEDNNEHLPECSPISMTPCKDSTSKLIWSAKSAHPMNWKYAIKYCDDLTEGDYNDWHLPTISELRTLIQHSAYNVTGGLCKVSDSCLRYDECGSQNCDDHSENENDSAHDKFGDKTSLWSSSVCIDCSEHFCIGCDSNYKTIWTLYSRASGVQIYGGQKPSEESQFNPYVRCVR